MNRKLDVALVFFALTIFCGLAFIGQRKQALEANDKALEVALDPDSNQATQDYYDKLRDDETTKSLTYMGGTGVLALITLTLGFRGTQQYFKDEKQAKFDLEERRQNELLEATRQAQKQPQPIVHHQPSVLHTAKLHENAKSAEEILNQAKRLYEKGDIDGAMFILEMSDDPRARKVLAKLHGMQK
ncbi:MAG: hypothetical protein HY862_03685 [Chloroflexi bacterium]|nr:hypothetical protein [Chloroflexota bacterium]